MSSTNSICYQNIMSYLQSNFSWTKCHFEGMRLIFSQSFNIFFRFLTLIVQNRENILKQSWFYILETFIQKQNFCKIIHIYNNFSDRLYLCEFTQQFHKNNEVWKLLKLQIISMFRNFKTILTDLCLKHFPIHLHFHFHLCRVHNGTIDRKRGT